MRLFGPRDSTFYDSGRRRLPIIDELIEVIHYRELLRELIARNIKIRYKRSVLGIAWTMLNPMMMMIVMVLVFANLFRTNVEHYSVYVLSGITFWTFFSQSTLAAMNELIWGGNLLTRIYIPRSIFALTAVGTGLVNIFLSLIPLFLIMLVTGAPLKPSLLFLPIPIFVTAMFALGVGLFLSTLAVYFVDVLEMYQIVLMAWMYLTPIIYPLDIVPQQYHWAFKLNPAYYLLEFFRLPIYPGRLPDLKVTLIALIISCLALLIGWWTFTRKADEFAYRV
jgi:ABC-2 type transport system permease protein